MSTKILIFTPSYGGSVNVEYMASLLRLLPVLRERKFAPEVALVSYAQVEKVRNYAASRLLLESYSHLLFIDSDMGFNPETVLDMLTLNEPLVAVAYPKRSIDFKRAEKAFKQARGANDGLANALEFVSESAMLQGIRDATAPEKKLKLRQGKFVRCEAAGTGIMLIRKDVVERMADAYPELMVHKSVPPYSEFGSCPAIFQCFEALRNEDNIYISEDLSFCRRWRMLGGEIWVNIADEITHVGQKAFTTSFLHRYI